MQFSLQIKKQADENHYSDFLPPQFAICQTDLTNFNICNAFWEVSPRTGFGLENIWRSGWPVTHHFQIKKKSGGEGVHGVGPNPRIGTETHKSVIKHTDMCMKTHKDVPKDNTPWYAHVCMRNTHTHTRCGCHSALQHHYSLLLVSPDKEHFLWWKCFRAVDQNSADTFPTWPFTSELAPKLRPRGAQEQVTAALSSPLAPALEPSFQLSPLSRYSSVLTLANVIPNSKKVFFSSFCQLFLLH